MFGEIAARPPGARTVDLMNYACDIDLFPGWAEAVLHGRFSQPIERKYNAAIIFKRAQGRGASAASRASSGFRPASARTSRASSCCPSARRGATGSRRSCRTAYSWSGIPICRPRSRWRTPSAPTCTCTPTEHWRGAHDDCKGRPDRRPRVVVPAGFIEEVNRRDAGVVAEFVKLGGTRMDEPRRRTRSSSTASRTRCRTTAAT